MSNEVDEVITELIKALKSEFEDFDGLYLFGLYLDGKMHEDEDIEIVAIFNKEQDKTQREHIWRVVGKVEESFDVFIDLHPLTIKEFKKDTELYSEVTENGIFFNKDSF